MVFFNTTQKVSTNPCFWKSPNSPRQKKARQSKSKFKAMTIVFFPTSKGMFTWIGCLNARPLTRSATRRFWQTFVKGWKEEDEGEEEEGGGGGEEEEGEGEEGGDDDDDDDLKCGRTAREFFTKTTRRHTTLCLLRLFDKAQDDRAGTSTVLTWPRPMWLILFPKIKSALEGNRFESVDAVKANATELVSKLSEDDLQHCFQQ